MNNIFNSKYIDTIYKNGKDTSALNNDEELRLIKLAKNGEVAARNEIVMHNMKLICRIAKRYCLYYKKDIDDLISCGTLAAIHAIYTFDLDSSSFTSYLYVCVKATIYRYIAKFTHIY